MDDKPNQLERFGLPEDHALKKLARQNRRKHLKYIQQIREGARPKPRDDTALGRVALSIPELDFAILRARFPDLASPDNARRTAAWREFMKGPLAEIYRVYKHE